MNDHAEPKKVECETKTKKNTQYQTVVIISRPLSDCHSESEQTKENLDVDFWRLYNPVICNYEKLN